MNNKECIDWEGNVFPSETAMCKHYNVHVATYRSRVRRGCSMKEALTGMSDRNDGSTIRGTYDHLGNWFPNVEAKCGYYNISTDTYYMRKCRYWSEEQALTVPVKQRK